MLEDQNIKNFITDIWADILRVQELAKKTAEYHMSTLNMICVIRTMFEEASGIISEFCVTR